MMPGRHVAAARVLVRPFHRLELLVDVELPARFEQQHLHPLRGEDVRGHAAGGARANHDGVVDAGQVGLGLWRALDQSKKIHVLNRGASPLGLPCTREARSRSWRAPYHEDTALSARAARAPADSAGHLQDLQHHPWGVHVPVGQPRVLTSRNGAEHTPDPVGTPRHPASSSTFRTVALVTSTQLAAVPEENLYLRYEDTIVVTDTGFENFTDFLPMELDDMERLVLEKGVVQKVPPTPAAAIPKRR